MRARVRRRFKRLPRFSRNRVQNYYEICVFPATYLVAYKSGRVARVPVARRRYAQVDDETRRRSVPIDPTIQQSRDTNFQLISHDP